MRPKRSRAAWTSACWSSQLATSQRTAIAFSSPPSFLGERLELVLRASGEHDAVAELDRAVCGGGANAGAGAGDH